eukprot:m.29025 g.29025  ORF g.29025 m.29025 type:complete len:254 (+) comp8055_c0_seq2:306-1067(+)
MSSFRDYDYLMKIVLIGDIGTGKSSLVGRFCENEFSTSYVGTIGVDFKIKTVPVSVSGVEYIVKMQLWDTAGQERFRSITRSFYRGAHVMCFVYDVTMAETFDHISKWIEECNEFNGTEALISVLIGNKSDLVKERQVPFEDAITFAERRKMLFAETSAKNSTNVEEIFQTAAVEFVGRFTSDLDSKRKLRSSAHRNLNDKPKNLRDPEPNGCWAWLKQITGRQNKDKQPQTKPPQQSRKYTVSCAPTPNLVT